MRCAKRSFNSGGSTAMPARILIVEDDADAARLLGGALRSAGEPFDVTAVASVHAALEHLAAHPTDCVVLDYRLPDAEGLEGLRRIRQTHPDVPVVIVTGAGSEDVAVEAM